MTTFALKLIACFTMLIDHTGLLFFPEYEVFRIIGRIAFPIFAFLIAEGYYHTHNIKKYFRRLFIFGIISQIPYALFLLSQFGKVNIPSVLSSFGLCAFVDYNIFATLILGLLAIYIYDKNKKIGIPFLVIVCVLIHIFDIPIDYKCYGVLIIFFFYIFRNSLWKKSLSLIILTSLTFLQPIIFRLTHDISLQGMSLTQAWSVLALIFVFMYNDKKGKNIKYIFYVFYPAHLLILFLINYLLI